MQHTQEGVGHYGVFNGTRWRTEIQPRIREFIRAIEYSRGAIPLDRRTARRSSLWFGLPTSGGSPSPLISCFSYGCEMGAFGASPSRKLAR